MTDRRHVGLALVTGASSGIGLELARQFATHHFDLIIAAENATIFAVARELESTRASVEGVQVNLATTAGVDELYGRVEAAGRPLAAAALNAGIGARGAFATDIELEAEHAIVDLNVRSTVHLAKRLIPAMVQRGEGRLLFTSSTGATESGAFQAVYNASKAFVHSFALSLREELRDAGVIVTLLVPGPTDTPFFERANTPISHHAGMHKDHAADVARAGFEALMNGDELVVTRRPPPTPTVRRRVRRWIGRVRRRALSH